MLRRWLIIAAIVVPSVILDQVTKVIAVAELSVNGRPGPRISLLGDVIRLQYSENVGAFLSLGQKLPDTARYWIFILVPAAIVIGVSWFLSRRRPIPTWDIVAYALLLSGAIGNLIDRVINHGVVRDFLNLGLGDKLRTGIFNVADVAIMAGLFMLLATMFWSEKGQKSKSTSAPKKADKEPETA